MSKNMRANDLDENNLSGVAGGLLRWDTTMAEAILGDKSYGKHHNKDEIAAERKRRDDLALTEANNQNMAKINDLNEQIRKVKNKIRAKGMNPDDFQL